MTIANQFAPVWNASGVNFSAIRANVTDIASSGGSTLLDLRVNDSGVMTLNKSGLLSFGGTTSSYAGIQGSGTSIRVSLADNSGDAGIIASTGTFSSVSLGGDAFLVREAANILAQRNSTNAQTFRLYGTYTDAFNYERGVFTWSSNTFVITTQNAGTGLVRNIRIQGSDGVSTWEPGGTLVLRGGNAQDSFYSNAAGSIQFDPAVSVPSQDGRYGNIYISAGQVPRYGNDGNASILMHTGNTERMRITGAGLVTFGGITSSFPAIKRNGTALNFRLADDSADAPITAGAFTITQPVSTSGSPTAFTLTGAAHTTLTASTEATDVNFNLARTVQFAAGALTTQRAFRIQAPTYSFASASTITTASTLSISGAPVAGTNATITNSYALNVEGGTSNFTNIIGNEFTSRNGNSVAFQVAGGGRIAGHGNGISLAFGHQNGWSLILSQDFGLSLSTLSELRWGDNADVRSSGSITLALGRDATDILAQRRSTNSQTFRLYNTITDASNYIRQSLSFTTYSTTVHAQLAAEGAGTGAVNVPFVITPRGTGAFILGPMPDGTATGGNARGANAVDLQTTRSAATQVASGQCSFAAGQWNTAANQATIAMGILSTASNFGAVAIGDSCVSSGDVSFSTGRHSVSDRYGMRSHGVWRFANNGDAQYIRFVLSNKTTNTTATTLFLRSDLSTRLTIPSGKVFAFVAKISGIKSDGTAAAFYTRKGCIKNVGGTTSLVGTVEMIGNDIEDNGATDIAITADNTNDALQIDVTGITGETWRWVAVVEGVEIGYGT